MLHGVQETFTMPNVNFIVNINKLIFLFLDLKNLIFEK